MVTDAMQVEILHAMLSRYRADDARDLVRKFLKKYPEKKAALNYFLADALRGLSE